MHYQGEMAHIFLKNNWLRSESVKFSKIINNFKNKKSKPVKVEITQGI